MLKFKCKEEEANTAAVSLYVRPLISLLATFIAYSCVLINAIAMADPFVFNQEENASGLSATVTSTVRVDDNPDFASSDQSTAWLMFLVPSLELHGRSEAFYYHLYTDLRLSSAQEEAGNPGTEYGFGFNPGVQITDALRGELHAHAERRNNETLVTTDNLTDTLRTPYIAWQLENRWLLGDADAILQYRLNLSYLHKTIEKSARPKTLFTEREILTGTSLLLFTKTRWLVEVIHRDQENLPASEKANALRLTSFFTGFSISPGAALENYALAGATCPVNASSHALKPCYFTGKIGANWHPYEFLRFNVLFDSGLNINPVTNSVEQKMAFRSGMQYDFSRFWSMNLVYSEIRDRVAHADKADTKQLLRQLESAVDWHFLRGNTLSLKYTRSSLDPVNDANATRNLIELRYRWQS